MMKNAPVWMIAAGVLLILHSLRRPSSAAAPALRGAR